MPRRYTYEGEDIASPLPWSAAPEGMKSFVLIVNGLDAADPAAPRMTWVHRVLYNLLPTKSELPGGISSEALSPGKRLGPSTQFSMGHRESAPCRKRERESRRRRADECAEQRFPDRGRPL